MNSRFFCDIQSGCEQVWHEEHLGEGCEARAVHIAVGLHPGRSVVGAADCPVATMAQGGSPALRTDL